MFVRVSLILAASGQAQEAANVGALTGTLKKVRDTARSRSAIAKLDALLLSQSAATADRLLDRPVPRDRRGVSTELDGMAIKITFAPVTPANRLQKVASGEIDLECGSTTTNVAAPEGGRLLADHLRRRHQADGAEVLARPVLPRPRRQDGGRDRRHDQRGGAAHALRQAEARHHDRHGARSRAIVRRCWSSGKADAFATDDVLLYGFIATAKNASDMKVVGEYLSYDPYGLVYRRDDPAFAAVVERTFARMASERRLAELYNKWFLRRLPTGETLNLPMSPQLEEIFRMLGQPE